MYNKKKLISSGEIVKNVKKGFVVKKIFLGILLLSVLSGCLFKEKETKETKKQIDVTRVHDVVIIGSGPAGLTAGIYAARAGLKPIILEGNHLGGLLTWASSVENWPGEENIKGSDLMDKIVDQTKKLDCAFLSDSAVKVDFSGPIKKIITEGDAQLKTKSVIIATGTKHKGLKVPGEKKYIGRGVSFCAICDASMYKNKKVVVVGGASSALAEAEYLANIADEVTIIHRSPKFTAQDVVVKRVLKNKKIKTYFNHVVKEIKGDKVRVTDIVVENKLNKEVLNFKTDAVFIAIGFKTNTEVFKDQIERDAVGYIVLKKGAQTSKEGVFAAGDVTNGLYKQAIVAAGDGAKAALDCQRYLTGRKE
jgi:thioredoxin reductase (NADPH)